MTCLATVARLHGGQVRDRNRHSRSLCRRTLLFSRAAPARRREEALEALARRPRRGGAPQCDHARWRHVLHSFVDHRVGVVLAACGDFLGHARGSKASCSPRTCCCASSRPPPSGRPRSWPCSASNPCRWKSRQAPAGLTRPAAQLRRRLFHFSLLSELSSTSRKHASLRQLFRRTSNECNSWQVASTYYPD